MNCKICKASTQIITTQKVLNKYAVNYHRCSHCHFIQTDTPFWLAEAYTHAITSLDIGLLSRNQYLQKVIPEMLDTLFPDAAVMLDYGGGYGMFVRMMRDIGYNFYRQDVYCENLFANYFDLKDSPVKKFDVLTSFEVFEHLENPLEELEKMFALSDHIIFSTVLILKDISQFGNWWYVSPLIGQHIAFYERKTLEVLAARFDKQIFSNDQNLHLLTSRKLNADQVNKAFGVYPKSFMQKLSQRVFYKLNPAKRRNSLLEKDYQLIEGKLKLNE